MKKQTVCAVRGTTYARGLRTTSGLTPDRSGPCSQDGLRGACAEREGCMECTTGSFGGCARLEPYAGKLAPTVLRGQEYSNVLLLSDQV